MKMISKKPQISIVMYQDIKILIRRYRNALKKQKYAEKMIYMVMLMHIQEKI